MGIKVMFRGPMLLLSKKNSDHLHEVIIPDASKAGCHPDHTTAKRHYAGILVVVGGKEIDWVDLSGASKIIIKSDGETGPPKVDPISYKSKLSLGEMIESTRPLERIRPPGATSVTLVGGSVSFSAETGMKVTIPKHKTGTSTQRKIPTLTVWEGGSTGSYQIDGSAPVTITQDMELYVYNWDERYPLKKALADIVDIKVEFADLDSKWVYSLFKPRDEASWDEWLEGRLLPVPQSEHYQPIPCNYFPTNIRERDADTGTCDHPTYIEG